MKKLLLLLILFSAAFAQIDGGWVPIIVPKAQVAASAKDSFYIYGAATDTVVLKASNDTVFLYSKVGSGYLDLTDYTILFKSGWMLFDQIMPATNDSASSSLGWTDNPYGTIYSIYGYIDTLNPFLSTQTSVVCPLGLSTTDTLTGTYIETSNLTTGSVMTTLNITQATNIWMAAALWGSGDADSLWVLHDSILAESGADSLIATAAQLELRTGDVHIRVKNDSLVLENVTTGGGSFNSPLLVLRGTSGSDLELFRLQTIPGTYPVLTIGVDDDKNTIDKGILAIMADSLRPAADDDVYLGGPNFRWKGFNTMYGAFTDSLTLANGGSFLRGTFVASAAFTYSGGDQTIITALDGWVVADCYLQITTTFDGTGVVTVGDASDDDGFLDDTDINQGATGYYGGAADEHGDYLWDTGNGHSINKIYTGSTAIHVDVVQGTATQGAGTAWVVIQRLK